MCGISGMFGLGGRLADPAVLARMTDAIAHRGPDDAGFFTHKNAGFGFRRLAILDLSPNGHQPMTTADGRYTIVYNGEIYNYVELRRELIGRGHVFRSTGDTEVLLHAFQEWGTECAKRLNGMWALLIYDAVTGKLFGSRDRFGIKPLFVWRSDSIYLFASEIKGIRASGLYRDATNWKTAAEFLVNGSIDRTQESFYEGIESLAPGTWFELTAEGRYSERRYWSPPDPVGRTDSAIFKEFGDLFEDAVRIHSRSDVPVAVHLSGGLDSTSIICALARQRDELNPGQEIRAFSYMSPEFDESAYIADTLRQTHANLVRLSASPAQLWDALGEMLSYHDEPVHSPTALVSYALMRETARDGIKVVLNGQGADETLAGYPTYFGIMYNQLLATGGWGAAAREMRSYTKGVGKSFWGLVGFQFQFFVRAKLAAFDAYRKISVAKRNAGLAENSWYAPELLEPLKKNPFVRFDLSLRDTLLRSMFKEPLPLYLRVEDRNAMAWSVESRVPFLDYRLVELALAADCRQLLDGPYNKRLLREGMAGRIPESVRLRVDKMGFPTPARQWLSGELFESVCDLVTSRALVDSGIVEMPKIRHDLDRFKRGEADLSMPLFRLSQFGIWLEKPTPRQRGAAPRKVSDGVPVLGQAMNR